MIRYDASGQQCCGRRLLSTLELCQASSRSTESDGKAVRVCHGSVDTTQNVTVNLIIYAAALSTCDRGCVRVHVLVSCFFAHEIADLYVRHHCGTLSVVCHSFSAGHMMP